MFFHVFSYATYEYMDGRLTSFLILMESLGGTWGKTNRQAEKGLIVRICLTNRKMIYVCTEIYCIVKHKNLQCMYNVRRGMKNYL